MRLLITAFILAAVLPVATVNAQITVHNDNIPTPGTVDRSASVDNLDAGIFNTLLSGGGNQTFDFSSLTYSELFPATIVSLGAAPYADSFPTATYATQTPQGSSNSDSAWSFVRSDASVFADLGRVTRISGFGDVVQTYDLKTPDVLFPLNYNDQWISIREWSSSAFGVDSEGYDTTFYQVDGWGTAVYNGESRPCLRASFFERITVTTSFGGLPVSTTIDSLEGAFFFGESFEFIAIVQKSFSGGFETYFSTMAESFIGTPTDVRESGDGELPEGYALEQNYPNPFNPATEIAFSLPGQSHVRLEIFNLLGQSIDRLVDQTMPAGSYTATWNGTSGDGTPVASGIYFYRLSTDQHSMAKKMLLLK